MIFVWIIVSLILFSIIVLIHEFWHFSSARFFWVKVEEFWLWIPPRAKKLFYDKKWTLYSLNWLPIWWFVKLSWEFLNNFHLYNDKNILYNNINEIEEDIKNWKIIYDEKQKKVSDENKKIILKKINENKASYNLLNKPIWQQSIIILAWVFMNFILAILIFSFLFFIWVKPIWINTKIETNLDLKLIPTYEQAVKSWLITKKQWLILYPIEWSIAEKNWIKEWNVILEINWKEINDQNNMIEIIKNNSWKEINIKIKDNNNIKNINLKVSEDWKIWSYISENISINNDFYYKYSIIDSLKNWIKETLNQSLLTIKWLWILIKKIFIPESPTERKEAISQVSWPIWIVNLVSNTLSEWFVFIMILWAIISINLWIFNLLPIPALDWWRFIFIATNGLLKIIVWKKIINEKLEWYIHFIFFVFLIALSIIIAYNDINKIISN